VNVPSRAILWTAAALLGIITTAGIAWSASKLAGQHIGLAAIPISVERGLAPAAPPATAHRPQPVVRHRKAVTRHGPSASTTTAVTGAQTITTAHPSQPAVGSAPATTPAAPPVTTTIQAAPASTSGSFSSSPTSSHSGGGQHEDNGGQPSGGGGRDD
jgi:hypothetical protein